MGRLKLRRGQRVRVLRSIETQAFYYPIVERPHSVKCRIPKGTILRVKDDHAEEATAFGCEPEAYKEMELQLIPEAIRQQPEYTGYYLMLYFEDLGKRFKIIE